MTNQYDDLDTLFAYARDTEPYFEAEQTTTFVSAKVIEERATRSLRYKLWSVLSVFIAALVFGGVAWAVSLPQDLAEWVGVSRYLDIDVGVLPAVLLLSLMVTVCLWFVAVDD